MSASDVVIRPARPDDAPRVHALHTSSVRTLCAGHYSADVIEAWLSNRTPAGYLGPIERGALFVAERGGRIVGFGEAAAGTVIAVYVDPGCARQGVGTAILRHALALAHRNHDGPIRLEATVNARDFYEHSGFREIRRAPVERNHVDIPVVVMEYDAPSRAEARMLEVTLPVAVEASAVEAAQMQERVARLLPSREGHFVFESGHHGQVWLDLERLFLHPDRVRPLAEGLADRLREHRLEAVCGPLVEGAFVGLMVASSLHLPFTYSEPVRDERATGLFPVSYPIPKPLQPELHGKRVAIVNDVINAGSAVRGTLASLKQCGAQPVVVGTLAVYGPAASELAATHDVALVTLASFPSRIWEPSRCPLCANGVPLLGHAARHG